MSDQVKDPGTDDVQHPLKVLSAQSLLPLGAALLVMTAGISSAVWLNSTLMSLSYKLDSLTSRLDRIESSRGGWMDSDMRAWVALLAARNPNLSVPPVDR